MAIAAIAGLMMQADSVAAALRATRLDQGLSIAAMLSALVVPVAGVMMLQRPAAGRPRWRQAVSWLAGCSGLLVYGIVAMVFGVCWGGQTGTPGKYRLARAYGAQVVAGLDRYHRVEGGYPPSLDALAPRYLSSEQLRAPRESPLRSSFDYRLTATGYTLRIEFAGPGNNDCHYEPGREWSCSGYF